MADKWQIRKSGKAGVRSDGKPAITDDSGNCADCCEDCTTCFDEGGLTDGRQFSGLCDIVFDLTVDDANATGAGPFTSPITITGTISNVAGGGSPDPTDPVDYVGSGTSGDSSFDIVWEFCIKPSTDALSSNGDVNSLNVSCYESMGTADYDDGNTLAGDYSFTRNGSTYSFTFHN